MNGGALAPVDGRVALALLTIAEAVQDVAHHAGYSGCKRLADEVQTLLSGDPPGPPQVPSADPDDDD